MGQMWSSHTRARETARWSSHTRAREDSQVVGAVVGAGGKKEFPLWEANRQCLDMIFKNSLCIVHGGTNL